MAPIELRSQGPIAYREAAADPETAAPVLCLHGYPESSRMWTTVMEALAAGGRRAIAPDLYGLGDSRSEGPQTFESNLEALTRFVDELGLGRAALCAHDWGGFVGLAWACEHPDAVEALVISNTGFFADGKWHGMAEALRSEQGEQLVGAIDRAGFAGLLSSGEDAFSDEDIDAYWRPFADGRGQRTTLEFYRSMDFAKLAPWQGKLGELGVPTLLLWGGDDQFARIASARRFEREIPGSKLVVLDGVGHFVIDERRERCAEEIASFLGA
jgi:haloalkane dehalogenase